MIAVVFAQRDAVFAQDVAGHVEEAAGGEGLGEAERDGFRAFGEAGGDDEGHAEAFAEDFVDEGDERQVVEADLDGGAGELLA